MKTITVLAFVAIAHLACIASNAVAQSYNDPFSAQPTPAPVASWSPPISVWEPALSGDARKIALRHEAEKAEIQKDARKQIRKLRLELLAALRKMQDRYAHDAKLDEAIAIRECVREQGRHVLQPLPDPGNLLDFSNSVGRALFFRVTGDGKKSVWGNNPYTTDSALSSAAVHAGVLKAGQTGVVKVTMLPGQDSYRGSTRNDITSASWGSCPVSYRVALMSEKDEDIEETPRAPVLAAVMPNGVRVYRSSNGYYSAAPMPAIMEEPLGRFPVAPVAVAPAPQLPDDAEQLIDKFEAESTAIHKVANRKIAELRRKAIADLKPLQDNLTREKKLDEAVAIRDYVRELKEPAENVLPDPGNLNAYPPVIGKVFYFRVTGARGRAVWGAEVYTAHSVLAATAVHAGVLKEGQTGVVKVTILPGRSNYPGMTRNGITSYALGQFSVSYRVERADVDEAADAGTESRSKPAGTAANPQGDKSRDRQLEELRQEVSRLERSLREVTSQLRQIHEEEEMLKKPKIGR